MAGRVAKEVRLDSRDVRGRLQTRGKPYYRSIGQGLHLGYRKNAKGGVWVARTYQGGKDYVVETIGKADDTLPADGKHVLDWWQACELVRGQTAGPQSSEAAATASYTVADACGEYLATAETKGQKSLRSSRNAIAEHILPAFGKTLVIDLTARAIGKWRDQLATTPPRLRSRKDREQKFAPVDMTDPEVKRQRQSTANRVLTTMKAVLNHAFKEDRVDNDRAWRKVKSFKAVDAARVDYVTTAEVERIANAAPANFRQIVLAGFHSGARYGELCRLRVRDFNADAGVLSIRISKSGKARHVVLTDEAIAFFTNRTIGRAGSETMFLRADGEPWGPSHQSRPMREACAVAKVTPAIGFHGLRHGWASLAAMAGVPLLVIARNLGHSDTRMVEKHYGHLTQDFVTDIIRARAPRIGTTEVSNVQVIV